MTAYFVGMNRPGVVSLSTAAELAGNVISMPLLFGQAGLPGAALANQRFADRGESINLNGTPLQQVKPGGWLALLIDQRLGVYTKDL